MLYSILGHEYDHETYNDRLNGIRKRVECCFGYIKGKFMILELLVRAKQSNCLLTLTSCVVLHNYLRSLDPDLPVILYVF